MKPTPKPCDCHPNNPRPRYKNVKEDGQMVHYCKDGYNRKYPPKKIPKESARRKRERPQYMKKRAKILETNPDCALKIPGICTGKATTIQHMKGRDGSLYLDEEHFEPACWACNNWAGVHSKQAIELGAAKSRHKKAG